MCLAFAAEGARDVPRSTLHWVRRAIAAPASVGQTRPVGAESDKSALTALLVPVPAADPVVSTHRQSLDPSARWGVPAHVTLLFPFLPPSQVSYSVVNRIDNALSALTAIDFSLERTGWFDDQVLWLAPHPDDPFRRLIQILCDAFPECPPYGGAFGEPVPHLTIGDRSGGASRADLQAAESAVASRLPVRATADTIVLMTGRREPGSWQTTHAFSLGRSH